MMTLRKFSTGGLAGHPVNNYFLSMGRLAVHQFIRDGLRERS